MLTLIRRFLKKENAGSPSSGLYRRLDGRSIPAVKHEIRLFAKVKNERDFLPFFLRYYRRMGVDRFFFMVNGSSDGTAEFLLEQKDSHVFSTEEPFGASFGGRLWTRWLTERFGEDSWCLFADADEIFLPPHFEAAGLRTLCDFLDREKAEVLPAILLDMYSARPVRETHYETGANPLPFCPYFDHDTKGGREENVRNRTFAVPNQTFKVPLVRFNRRMFVSTGHHFARDAKYSEIRGAVLHFKYFSRLFAVSKREAAMELHPNRAERYRLILAAFEKAPDLSLYRGCSEKFSGSRRLLELGIMTTNPAYDDLVKTVANPSRFELYGF